VGTDATANGLVILTSHRTLADVIAQLKQLMAARSLRIFAELDFSADALASGLQLRPTRLLIVGNPKAGTPLIEAEPTAAIDLPLKVLVWSDDQGNTRVAHNDPAYLAARHHLSSDLTRGIASLGALVETAAGDTP
jgi:uncharacterized protein (DUF302 family)